MALAIGLVPFTVQYVCLRAFYALEDTRTTFFLQIVIAAANVVFGVGVVVAAGLARPWWRPGWRWPTRWRTCSVSGSPSAWLQRKLPASGPRPIRRC